MNTSSHNKSAGFSLVEIMVGMVIGLIAVMVVGQVFSVAEAQKRTATSGSDATVNGSLALYTLERDGKNAGYGMTTVRGSLGCEIKARFSGGGGTVDKSFTLSPVTLSDGFGGAPDIVQFMASNKNGIALPARVSVDHPATAANFFVESDVGIENLDLMIAVPAVLSTATPPTNWCSVFQVTGTGGGGGGGGGGQGQNQVLHNSGQSAWNQPGGSTIFPAGGYSTNDYLINLGNFIDHSYTVAANNLRLTELNMATNTTTSQDLFPHIVQLQAVYGKDTNADRIVDAWNATVPASPIEWQQIRAVRVALVSRSQFRENQPMTLDGALTASTCATANPPAAAICWKPDPNGNGVKIDVNIGNAVPDWQNYRYRVFETTIPLRNSIWQQ